jgi:hypothetical protein
MSMQVRVQLVSVLVGLLLLAVVFQLVRKNRLLEKYSLLWIGSAAVLIFLALCRSLLERFAGWVGIYYAPSALFLVALFCGMIIALHFSVVVSDLTRQNKLLAQKVGLLETEILRLKTRNRKASPRPAGRRKA